MNERTMKQDIIKDYPTVGECKDKNPLLSYDLESPKAILELKARYIKRDYGDSQIEKQKYDKNMKIADKLGKDFYYVVYSQYHNAIYYWNVTKLANEGYDFGWQIKSCPQTTNFERREYVDKVVGGLKWSDAHRVKKL